MPTAISLIETSRSELNCFQLPELSRNLTENGNQAAVSLTMTITLKVQAGVINALAASHVSKSDANSLFKAAAEVAKEAGILTGLVLDEDKISYLLKLAKEIKAKRERARGILTRAHGRTRWCEALAPTVFLTHLNIPPEIVREAISLKNILERVERRLLETMKNEEDPQRLLHVLWNFNQENEDLAYAIERSVATISQYRMIIERATRDEIFKSVDRFRQAEFEFPIMHSNERATYTLSGIHITSCGVNDQPGLKRFLRTVGTVLILRNPTQETFELSDSRDVQVRSKFEFTPGMILVYISHPGLPTDGKTKLTGYLITPEKSFEPVVCQERKGWGWPIPLPYPISNSIDGLTISLSYLGANENDDEPDRVNFKLSVCFLEKEELQ